MGELISTICAGNKLQDQICQSLWLLGGLPALSFCRIQFGSRAVLQDKKDWKRSTSPHWGILRTEQGRDEGLGWL